MNSYKFAGRILYVLYVHLGKADKNLIYRWKLKFSLKEHHKRTVAVTVTWHEMSLLVQKKDINWIIRCLLADQQQRRSIGTSWHRQPAAAAIRRCNKMQQNLAAAQSMECYLLTQFFLVSWEIDKRGFIVRNTTNHSTFNGRSNATDKTQYTKETKDRGGWEGVMQLTQCIAMDAVTMQI